MAHTRILHEPGSRGAALSAAEHRRLLDRLATLTKVITALPLDEMSPSGVALGVLGLSEALEATPCDDVALMAAQWLKMSDEALEIGGHSPHDARMWFVEVEYLRRYAPLLEDFVRAELADGSWEGMATVEEHNQWRPVAEEFLRRNPQLPRRAVFSAAHQRSRILKDRGWRSVVPLLDLDRWALAGYLYALCRFETIEDEQMTRFLAEVRGSLPDCSDPEAEGTTH